MSDYSFPIPLDGTTTTLRFGNGVDIFKRPVALAPAVITGGDSSIATVALDSDGLGAVVQGVAVGTTTISVTDGVVTKTADLVVSVPALADFGITADPPAVPAS